MLKKPLLYLTSFILFSAHSIGQKTPCDFEKIKFATDTLKLEHIKAGYVSFSQIAKILKLDNINSGYTNKQIRIWLGHSLAIKHHIVILKFDNAKWTGEVLTYTRQDPTREITTFKILNYKKVVPNSGWDTFIDKINDTKILTEEFWKLPDCCGDVGPDGISYDFEIASSKVYTHHSFSNPSNKNQIGRKVLTFASFLEKELCFEYTK